MTENVIEGDPLGVIQGTAFLSDTKSKIEYETDKPHKVSVSRSLAVIDKTCSWGETSKIDNAFSLDINTNNLQPFDKLSGVVDITRTDTLYTAGVNNKQCNTLLASGISVCCKEINLIDFSPLEDHVTQNDFEKVCGNTNSVSANMGDNEDPNIQRSPSFLVMYLGSAVLDRRYPPQSIMPWVMAEVRRRKEPITEVMLEVLPRRLKAVTVPTEADVWRPRVLFEHLLHSLSRFAKTHQEPRCFAYLTRPNFYSDFECHVFLAHEEQTVPELFTQIREATQLDIFSEMGVNRCETAKAFYEVMYIGNAKVQMKKLSSTQVDELAEKLTVNKLEMKEKLHFEDDRQRHASGTSVQSLPSNLEDSVSVLENDLVKQHVQFRIYDLHMDSLPSSADELANLSDGLSSSENILESSSNVSNSSKSGENFSDSCLNTENVPVLATVKEKNNYNNFRNLDEDVNKTMLFRLGQYDVSLISLNKKSTLLERQFRDISSVSQGNQRSEVFCFIAREKSSVFICHVMKCHSGSVVDEIMTALRVAFKTAFEQNRQQICTMCPLHQLHKLCQEINGIPSQLAYEMICRRLQQLPDNDTVEIFTDVKNENPQSYEETVEVLMIGLRRLCELKQKEHSHISDTSKISSKSEFNILDNCSKSTTAFENLKKAKKSLANSFENLLRGRKKDDVHENFRQRSGTTDSESSWTGQSVDSSAPNTPDGSPTSSPFLATREAKFTFSSPPESPKSIQRPRSSTLGAIPDLSKFVAQRCKDLSHLDSKDSSMRRPGAQSPMRHMFLQAGSSTAESYSSSFTSPVPDFVSSVLTPTDRRHSWRQAIFNRVVTPARIPTTPTVPEAEEADYIVGSHGYRMSRQDIRDMWKKAIMETLLLIRMEKENQDLRARQDEADTKRKKLDYQEITPCLKEVTKVWDEMLLTPGKSDILFDQGKLLSCLKQGVPRSKRGDIWWLMTEQHQLRFPNLEEEASEVEYTGLLRQLTTHQHAILIDLGRTFPGHPYFETQLGPGQLSLFNILKAYSLLDKEVGYCQGLSFVAGILLMHMDETQAFEAIRHMMYNLGMRQQYRPNMISLQIQLYQLTRLLHDHYKDLYDHFEDNDIAPTLYAAPWFLTLFASQFPLGFVARVFDLIFLQGVEVIFKVALVLLGNHKELIMQCDSFETIVEFVKTTLPEMGIIQMERIINQAFELDLTKQLQAYEVEYHVLREEMIYSPQRGEIDLIHKLEEANCKLKQQAMDLLEKLQQANSQQHSLEIMIHNHQTKEAKLKSHIRTLEIERAALLNAVSKLKRSVPEEEFQKLDITLPVLLPSLPASPVHTPVKHIKSETTFFQNTPQVLCPSKQQ